MQSTWYRVQTTLSGANIKVSWNGQQLINWTDPSSPFLSGKVGLRQDNSMHAHWDNFVAWSTGAPTILAYDDYYPFGQNMDYRSYNNGFADARYKYTEKERDSETGYDYFGARYYDARVARWMSVEPLAEKYSHLSPYVYASNNPLRNVDPDGKDILDYLKGAFVSVVQSVNPSYEAPSVNSVSGDQHDYAAGRVAGDIVAMVIEAGEAVGGYGGVAGGVGVSATGVGAVVGVLAAVLSGAVAAHGVMTTVVAGGHLVVDAKSFMSQSSQPASTSEVEISFWKENELLDVIEFPLFRRGIQVAATEEIRIWLREQISLMIQEAIRKSQGSN